ncbi:MAG: sulfite exporter TauE/SafE family protein, partial [Bacteroidetes bacterium]
IIGLLNGLLPCGMVYVAVTGAIAAANAYEGALYMGFFGIGTSLSMSVVFYSAEFISESVRRKIRKLIPVFIFFIGIVFILRGLNLGIPYLSPKIINNTEMQCCHK